MLISGIRFMTLPLMGIILSKLPWFFKLTKSPDVYKKELEEINKELIEEVENKNALQSQYYVISEFVISYSRLLYIIIGIIFFFLILPSTFVDYVLFSGPLVIFYILVYALKKCLKWYFDNEIQRKFCKIKKLSYRKKVLLSEVKDKVKFKEAKEIIADFTPIKKNYEPNHYAQQRNSICMYKRKDSLFENVVKHVLREEKRNALICTFCQRHNGMALEEEFEYIGFRCCHCFAFNPPKKSEPIKKC